MLSKWIYDKFRLGDHVKLKSGNTGIITWVGTTETWGTPCSGYNTFLGYQIPSQTSKAVNVKINNDGNFPQGEILICQSEIEILFSQFLGVQEMKVK
jgi:hypothetical protein